MQDALPPLLPLPLPRLQSLLSAPLHLPAPPSPGAQHGCRIAVQTPEEGAAHTSAYVATGGRVYEAAVPLRGAGGGAAVPQGKEGVYLPTAVQGVPAQRLPHLSHHVELQSLTLAEHGGEAVLGAVDALGCATVTHWPHRQAGRSAAQPSLAYRLQPADVLREAGWAGCALAPGAPGSVAVARHFARDVALFERQLRTRTLALLHCPAAVAYLALDAAGCAGGATGLLLAVAEGHQVSLWDARAGEGGGCVQRLNAASPWSPVHALATTTAGEALLGAAGAERSVVVYDPRRWAERARWPNACKYEIFALHFSTAAPAACLASGADYEVLCAAWDLGARRGGGGVRTGKGAPHRPEESEGVQGLAFRGDSRWLGVSRAPGADVVAGFGASGNVFCATFTA